MAITNLYPLIDGFYQPPKDEEKYECRKCGRDLMTSRKALCRACQIKFRSMRFEFLEWDKVQFCIEARQQLVRENNEREHDDY